MSSILTEVVVILLLLLVNGVFAMTEIAVVSARKSRLRNLAERGDSRARTALALAESPNRFLSTVQIGITLVGILAGAFGGATVAEEIGHALESVPLLARYGEGIGITCVVLGITYVSLVLGELAPKRIGLGNPVGISLFMAGPMHRLSVIAGPVVNFLGASTDALLRLLGVKPVPQTVVTDDEVKVLMQEGLRAGAFHKVESEMVESVLDLDRLQVRDIMTPGPKMIWLSRDDSHETVWHKIVVSGHSFFPVYVDTRDHVVGIVSIKSIYANLAAGAGVRIADLMVKPLVVPAMQSVVQLVETFKQARLHIALATDEFGAIVGLVTLNDVMEAIVGDFPTQDERIKPSARKRDDGTWLIDAMIEIEQLEQVLSGIRFSNDESKDFQTLAGFVMKHMGRVPKEGETFEYQGYVFEVLDMDQHRVDKVLVFPSPNSAARDAGM